MKSWQRLVWIGIIAGLICASILPLTRVEAGFPRQAADPDQRAKALLTRMTPEEKVGQLFLITFRGRDVTSKDAKILDLIKNRNVGGVILRAANDNFTGPQGTLDEVYRMTSALQKARSDASKTVVRNLFGFTYTPQYIPLFIGVSQQGDLYPNDQILSGLTPLPSAMAQGATWDTKQAERVGNTLGNELSSLGINLLIGPSLDVSQGEMSENDLGVQTFGGDPYWVGMMGQAFITGVHHGSGGQIAVIPHSFPGAGAADRSPQDEVATVRKTNEQLKNEDLTPFKEVTGNAASTTAMADGLLLANIRYQGLQGAIRTNTRPLIFDTAAVDQLLAVPELARWRQGGGLLVSDDLGSQAIRKFYDSAGQVFDPRQVARSALLGGSDILYADNFTALGDPDSYTTLTRVLDFLVQKYREDPAFAQRVDLSVLRILTLKAQLYVDFSLNSVVPNSIGLVGIGQSPQISLEMARQAVTLVQPAQSEFNQVLPRPPELNERILIFTDMINFHQCSQCPSQAVLAVDALQNVALRLYGPRAGGQIAGTNLASYSFLDLKYFLDSSKDKIPANLEDNLKLADWIWVAVLDNNPARPESQAFRQLLSARPDLLRNKKVVVFAFNAPYYLDSTDLSKISVYYALYSKTAPFVEVAVRILFQELTPGGNLPVSVSGSGYNLRTVLSPDPAQVISLEVDQPSSVSIPTINPNPKSVGTPSATPTLLPTVKVGDTLPLRTGVILDHNRNPVPNGTPVRFIFTPAGAEIGVVQQINSVTVDGIARTAYRIQSVGSLEIRVVSERAETSKLLRVNISTSGAVAITAVMPTLLPPIATLTPTPTSTPTLTPTATPTPTPPPPVKAGTSDWVLSLLIAWGAGAVFFWLGRMTGSLRWAVRWGLLAITGGLLAYSYIAAGLPGGSELLEAVGKPSLLWMTLLGALSGWLIGYVWKLRWERENPQLKK